MSAKPFAFERIREPENITLHECVRRRISMAIIDGKWKAGEVLPSEVVLAQEFGVSVGTIRKALAALTADGALMRRRKTGTVVTGWSPLHNLSQFYRHFRLHDRAGHLLKSRAVLLDYESGPCTQREAETLHLETAQTVIRLKRVRYVNGHAAMTDFFVLASVLLPRFPDKDKVPELLYLFLLEKYDIRIAAVREHITAELASPEVAQLLKVKRPHAVLRFEEIAFDQQARPIIYATHCASTDHFQYINEIR